MSEQDKHTENTGTECAETGLRRSEVIEVGRLAETAISKASHTSRVAMIKQNKNQYAKRMRENVLARSLSAPVVIGAPLCDPGFLTFGDFLCLPSTQLQFGLDSDSATLLGKLVEDREFMLLRWSRHPGNKE